jgi:serine/threonine protein kinase
MSTIIKLKATDGTTIEFVDKMIGQGGMKDVYFSPDKSYVVAFFRSPQDFNAKDRLNNIVGVYRQRIFDQPGGEYWKTVYCWPTHVVEHNGRLGVCAPTYASHFFFKFGSKNNDSMLSIKGKDKEGKWFSTGTHQQKYLDDRERGDWRSYFQICVKISRAVKRLHAAGLAHSDLSYKNVLVDPISGSAAVIDIDGLVVPGKFAPDVIGTPDFIAPEVMATLHLPVKDPNRKLPRIETDRHALAVLIYMYMLYRHPLKGGLIHPAKTEEERQNLEMGSKALFIEHQTDNRNRPNLKEVKKSDLPFADVTKLPYTITGPYLKALFDRAFVDGLHNPSLRPLADEWETALIKTVDLMQPCLNSSCTHKWYVFDNTTKPKCPFCATPFTGTLPVLNLYTNYGQGSYKDDKHRLMVYANQYIYKWHANRNVILSPNLSADDMKPVGYFSLVGSKWVFVNQKLTTMVDATKDGAPIPVTVGSKVELFDGQKLILDSANGGRLVSVQMIKA